MISTSFLVKTYTALISIGILVAPCYAGCLEDEQSPEFQAFIEAATAEDIDYTVVPELCENAGGDWFGVTGNATCGDKTGSFGGTGSQINCMPASCISETRMLKSKLMTELLELGPDLTGCTESFEFTGLGPGSPSWYLCGAQCFNDMRTFSRKTRTFKDELEKAERSASLNTPDYSGLEAICDAIDGYDFFTYSSRKSCKGETGVKTTYDVPYCMPSSCTSMNEEMLEEVFLSAQSGHYDEMNEIESREEEQRCYIAGQVTFSGLNGVSICGADPLAKSKSGATSRISITATASLIIVGALILL